MEISEGTGTRTAPWYRPEDAAALYAMALEANICVEYVRHIIKTIGLTPPPGYSAAWPWPVRLHTLGRFAVYVNEKPLTFNRNAQKKPLELLRALITFGGRDVPLEKLAQTLWPDTEADLAKRAFETTLHRLRKLLGTECIETSHGLLSFNSQYCWLDVWAFEELIDTCDTDQLQPVTLQRLIGLYHGSFLGDHDESWVLIQRERLRSKFLRTVDKIGHLFEVREDYASAALCYQRALETDPFAEGLYRRLMVCYRQLNRVAEALATYKRCHTALTSTLHVEPSQETTALFEEIRRGAS